MANENWQTAEEMLLEKMQQTDGITGYRAPYFCNGEHQDIAKAIYHYWCSHFSVDSDNLFIKKKVVFKDPAIIMQMPVKPLVVFHDTPE